jgi:hypothetical protein
LPVALVLFFGGFRLAIAKFIMQARRRGPRRL